MDEIQDLKTKLEEKTYELDKLREELKQLKKFLNIKKCIDCGSLSYKKDLYRSLCNSCANKKYGN